MKKYTALLMAAVMSASMASNALAASFSDINDVPWSGAEQYINKAADLGIMVGDKDSTGKQVFRAKDRVTYCEAMQIAYSVLKETNSLETTVDTTAKWTGVMQSANIPTWAYTSVAYGLESGIVSENDIKIFMKGPGENRDATRENVAVIFGKALSHIEEVNPSATLTFNDKDEITDTSVPYIDLLVRLNIMVGDDNNNFNPKNYINRAEMAVIVSKSYDKIEELKKGSSDKGTSGAVATYTGTIILTDNGTSEQTIALSDSTSGTVTNFVVNASTPVITLDGSTKTYSDISVGDKVTVTTSGGVVVSVIINDDKASEEKEDEKEEKVLEGYLNNISSKVVTFDTKDGDQERYEFSSNPRITLNGSPVTQNDIYEYVVERSMIYVKLTLDDNGKVSALMAEFCDVEGELTNVKDSQVYVKTTLGDNTKTVRIPLSNDCEIYLDGTKISESKAENLFDDDENNNGLYAVVKVDGFNKAEKVEIYHDTYNNGELISISSSKVGMKSGFGREVEYELDDDAEFRLNGNECTYKTIKNALEDGDVLVTLEFDKDNNVTKVTAQVKEVKGTLKAADDKRIVIVDEDDNRMPLDVDRNIECRYNGKKVTYSEFQKLYKDTENAVIAEAELNEEGLVEKVKATEGSDSEGKVIELSSSRIVFEDAAGVEHEYKVEPATRGYLNDEELFPASRVFEYARDDDATVRVTFSSRGYVNRIFVTLDD